MRLALFFPGFAILPACLVGVAIQGLRGEEPISPIPRVLPPEGGVALPPEVRASLAARVEAFSDRIWEIDHKDHAADVAVLVKAVDLALKHGEFYSEKDIPIAAEMLDLADERHRFLEAREELPWLKQRGRVVRGYRSKIDDSHQPFGLEIPEGLDLSKPVPLLVWLHGRGDKTTDLHFLHQCLSKSQAFGGFLKDQNEAVVLHPFGRHCVGWKHAGEIDVFEAIEAVRADYPIDPDRIILAGFSMGGAGAWHIGAHYRDRFLAVHAGAGFAETKEYNNLKPENYPPEYEQVLWKVYDVPNYVRNFLNGPLLAYSGAEDKQKAAADLMARELKSVGHELHHVIGEGMAHKYNETSVAAIREWMRKVLEEGRKRPRKKIEWQTPTLRYGQYDWIRLTGLEAHWKGAEISGRWDSADKRIHLDPAGITALEITPVPRIDLAGFEVRIGNAALAVPEPGFPVHSLSLVRRDGAWTWGEPDKGTKRPGLQGPIDDAFLSRFVVVPPDRDPADPRVARWTDFELAHFRDRWRALMRGELPEKAAADLDSDDLRDANLVLWGDPESNPLIAEMAGGLPVKWEKDAFVFRGERFARDGHVPVLVFPNPLNPERYVVINSGLTFREGHDRTNSQQNPKLPDWAVVSLDRDPDAFSPGRVVKAGFFDESWR